MSDLSNLAGQLNSFVSGVERSYTNGLDKAASDMQRTAKETIQEYIRNTPSGITPGKKDRIWTGAMLDNADARKTRSGNNYNIEYGWFGFTNPQGRGDYVKMQELGGGHVAFGMHSFAAVQQEIQLILENFREGKYFE